MAGLGIGLIWIAYTGGLYGYCLFRGYNVTPKQLLSHSWPPGTKAPANQGPPQYPGTPIPGTPT